MKSVVDIRRWSWRWWNGGEEDGGGTSREEMRFVAMGWVEGEKVVMETMTRRLS